jgi:hypothetical protein
MQQAYCTQGSGVQLSIPSSQTPPAVEHSSSRRNRHESPAQHAYATHGFGSQLSMLLSQSPPLASHWSCRLTSQVSPEQQARETIHQIQDLANVIDTA